MQNTFKRGRYAGGRIGIVFNSLLRAMGPYKDKESLKSTFVRLVLQRVSVHDFALLLTI